MYHRNLGFSIIRAISITVYIVFGIISYGCIRNSNNKILMMFLYLMFFLLELWNIFIIPFNHIFKLGSFYLLFNIAFIYIYIIFTNKINNSAFNIVSFLSLIVVSVVYYLSEKIDGKIHMILNPFSVLIGCYFFVVWVGLFLYNKNRFDQLMFLKFPFEIYFEFGRILAKNMF